MIKDNLSITEYHKKDGYISSSILKYATQSLLRFKAALDGKYELTRKPAFDFGNAFELALCDKEAYKNEVIVYDEANRPETDKGITSKLNQAWKQEIFSSDKYVISATGEDSAEIIPLMLDSAGQHPIAARLLSESVYQPSYFFECPETGLKIKSRPDLVRVDKHTIIDVKTAHDASPGIFANDAAKYNYPLQALMQIEGAEVTGHARIENYFWLVFEKKMPFDVVLYEFDIEDRDRLAEGYLKLKRRAQTAINENNFPGFRDLSGNEFGILPCYLPVWYNL